MSSGKRSFAVPLGRRSLLAAAGVAGVTAGIGAVAGFRGGTAPEAPAVPPVGPVPAAVGGGRPVPVPAGPPSPEGTTLAGVATPRGSGGYRRLAAGPGWPRLLRTELAGRDRDPDGKRTALAAFVQFTDLHLTDVQHPARYEFNRTAEGGGWRPQEALTVPGAVSLVERVNALRGPATGMPFSFVMTTGDNTDNNCLAELQWYLTVMSGGHLVPNTGDPRAYEGTQNSGLRRYWHPEDELRDRDKAVGFPLIDGFLQAAVRGLRSPGLAVPWYSTVGNHDLLSGGCYADPDGFFARLAVGDRKLMELDEPVSEELRARVRGGLDPRGEGFRGILERNRRRMRPVTPDPRRAPFTPREYVEAHLDPAHTGPGPVGHGYTETNLDQDTAYYSFRIADATGGADGVVGISLDTTDRGGHYQGSLGTGQLRWLERELARHRGAHVVVFSHHTSTTMTNRTPDPARPGERRHTGDELVALLRAHPNVVAWINGHSHTNRITPHGGFWEISTASHIDFPQLARVIELTDNGDGTLSLFTTLIESAAPYRADRTDLSATGLASLYRELACNAPGLSDQLAGGAADRNTELLLPGR